MKKIILFIVVMFAFAAISTAQTTWQSTQTIVGDSYGTWFGTGTHDTINTSTIYTEHIVRLKSENPLDLQLQCKFTKISGTCTGSKVTLYGSNDGVILTPVDSITIASDATGTVFKNLDDFNFSYLRLRGTAAGSSGLLKLDIYYSIRKE